MADEQTKQPSRADQYRNDAADYMDSRSQHNDPKLKTEISILSCSQALWSIAAELAEANSRDSEAEIRAKNAEAFVAGIQEELRRQGVIVSAGMGTNLKPPRR